ncbi:ATP-binding protein [Methylobacterium radiodurans]|uniref:C4-dicarboxylate transport sensor protein DctB n=1 Tax=Methylobacterium radiodurans TaxID=2202828 RepID=A0A2U8W198_9HYPH|nr:sensor histidine kinase [Methylobacterium radiodurans]
MVAAAWAGGRVAQRWALADLRRTARTTLTLQAGALHTEMQRQSALPLALAADPEIGAVLRAEGSGGGAAGGHLAERLSARLAEVAAATGAAVIYVIRPDGLTVAASNAASGRSFVGNNYAFRPYFRGAMAEESGSQFALGTVSGRPGLYLARRVGDGLGVVVVKVEFEAAETAWREVRERVFVTDARGIVLVASEPAWRFRTLAPLDAEARDRSRESLEFGDAPLEPLPLHPAGEDLVRLGRGAAPAQLMLMLDAPVRDTDWRIHTLTPVGAAVERERTQGQVIALLATGLFCLGLGTLLGRRARTQARLAEAGARRAELEARVSERTAELSAANDRLRDEIAERARSEAERERLGRELAQAGRLAALGQFAASMAHEINQPLAAIRSYADNTGILVRRGRVDDAAENVAAIGRLVDRIGGLTRQLKGFARRASGRREPVAVDEILRGSLEVVAHRAGAEGTDLVIRAEPGLAVIGEGARLEQVLVNLLQNALDAVAGRPSRRVELRVTEAGEQVCLVVQDNGPGISESARAKIFDAFFTTKPDGLGLGLAIARGIVEECGGTLGVEEAEGGGTVFRIALVRAGAPARELQEETP